MDMMEENLLFRLRAREICTRRPGTAVRSCRELYEYIVPNHTVHDVECPDHSIRKFTNDGQYLVCFGRTQQELIVYRFKGLGGSIPVGEHEDELPPEAKKFDGFFTRLYATVVVSNAAEPAQTLCKDFLLIAEGGSLAICATSSQPDSNPPSTRGALSGVSSMAVITLYLVRLSDGMVVDQKVFRNDYINLGHNAGVFLYDDLLAVLSVRYQCVHIFQVRENPGMFVDVRTVGAHCREDDELVLQVQRDAEARFQRERARQRRRSGLAARTSVREEESDSPSERVDADSTRIAESGDLDLDSESRGAWGGNSHARGLEAAVFEGRGKDSEVGSVGGVTVDSHVRRPSVAAENRDGSLPNQLGERRELHSEAEGFASAGDGLLSVLEERRRSHLEAGSSSVADGGGGVSGGFQAHFKRLPGGPREPWKMTELEIEAANVRAGQGELHRKLEGLRKRLMEEQGGSKEAWLDDGLHEEMLAGGALQAEAGALQRGEAESRPQVGQKRDVGKAGISHEWGDPESYYMQAAKRGRLSTGYGLGGRLEKRDLSDIDDCPSDFGREDAAEVPGQEPPQMHRFPFGGGLLGGQADDGEGGVVEKGLLEKGGPRKEVLEQGPYPPWVKKDAEPMRLHGGAPTNSQTVSFTGSEEDGDQLETGGFRNGQQERVSAVFGWGGASDYQGVQRRDQEGGGVNALGALQGLETYRSAASAWFKDGQLESARGSFGGEQYQRQRPTDGREGAHRQLSGPNLGDEGWRGSAGPAAWVPPTDEEDPMGRYSHVRPKSRREKLSDWEQAHWQLADSDSGEEGLRSIRGRRGPDAEPSSRFRPAPSTVSPLRASGPAELPLYQPFGSASQAHVGFGEGTGLAQHGVEGGSRFDDLLKGLPNRSAAMTTNGGLERGQMKVADGLGRMSKQRGVEDGPGIGLERGIVYNIEEDEEAAAPSAAAPRTLLRTEKPEVGAHFVRSQRGAAAPVSESQGFSAAALSNGLLSAQPGGEALLQSGRQQRPAATQQSWPQQGLRVAHGGVYTSDLIEHLGGGLGAPMRSSHAPPQRRPLGPEWGAPAAPSIAPLWGSAPHPFFTRGSGALVNSPGRSGFEHLHQAVGAVRAASRSTRSQSSGGEEEGPRGGSGALLAAGRMAGLYSPYQQQRSAQPRYEYVVSSRTQSHTSSEPLDDVSMPAATSARAAQRIPLAGPAQGPARAPHPTSRPAQTAPSLGTGPFPLGGVARSGFGRVGAASAVQSGRESRPGAGLALGARPSSGVPSLVSPVRGRPQGTATVTASGLSGRPLSHDEAHSGEAHSPGAPSASETAAAEATAQDNILCGIKQRLLSFIFRQIYDDEDQTPAMKAQRLKRVFYHFKHYEELVMWKVQFLDRHHLLLKFGSAEGVVARSSDSSTQHAFFALYNVETTDVLGFFQNTSEDFLAAFERFSDHFRVMPCEPAWMRCISSYANNVHAREHLRKQKEACMGSKAGGNSQVVKRALALLPFNCQSLSPSPYFDQSIFHYDEKLISAAERHKPCMEHPIKFISRKRTNALRFKIQPGPEGGSGESRAKRVASYVFHPILPFAISIQQTYMQAPVINFHFRWSA